MIRGIAMIWHAHKICKFYSVYLLCLKGLRKMCKISVKRFLIFDKRIFYVGNDVAVGKAKRGLLKL